MDFLNELTTLIEYIGNGLANFVDLILNFPSLFLKLINYIPNPLNIIISSFVSFLLIIITVKCIKLFIS